MRIAFAERKIRKIGWIFAKIESEEKVPVLL